MMNVETGGHSMRSWMKPILSPTWVLEAIRRFASERRERLATLSQQLASAKQ
jgi:transketolase